MASKKKRVEEVMTTETLERDSNESEENGFDEEDMDDDDENETPINEEVQVEFEARMLDDDDFHGVKTLLQQVFLKAHVSLSDLTNTLISQNFIGCVIKQMDVPDDDDDSMDSDGDTVFGLMSVLNLTEKKDVECVQQIRSLLMDRCKASAKDSVSRLSDVLGDADQHTGLLISERYLNIPPQISVPMFDSLMKDMEKCKRKKMKYDFARYVMISKTCRMKSDSKHKEEPIIFSNSEEELLHEVSELSFTYSVENERDTVVGGKWDSDNPMEALRTVMVIPADQLTVALTRIKAELAST